MWLLVWGELMARRTRFNPRRIRSDMDLRGWNSTRLALAAGVSMPTISRFLNGQVQTAKTAGKIAEALGYPIKRYYSQVEAA